MKGLELLLLLLGLQGCDKMITGQLQGPDCDSCNLSMCTLHPAVQAVGSLTGILLVILVLVVTGWVWTCWTLKKRKDEIQHCKNSHKQEFDSEEERFCPSQIYKMKKTQPIVGTAIEQPLEENGQSIDGLGSKDNKGSWGVNRVENFYSSSEGSNHSSLQEEQRVNWVKEGDYSGEKHMYHVLEKADDAVYEEPDKTMGVNTAMEYETHVPC